jgi:hypothetical protein
MDLLMYLLAVIICIIAFPLDEILKVIVPHLTVKDLLNLILVVAINNCCRWGRAC